MLSCNTLMSGKRIDEYEDEGSEIDWRLASCAGRHVDPTITDEEISKIFIKHRLEQNLQFLIGRRWHLGTITGLITAIHNMCRNSVPEQLLDSHPHPDFVPLHSITTKLASDALL
ncbi:hypothetical protein Tco_1503586 [Tanacetum coccineum]